MAVSRLSADLPGRDIEAMASPEGLLHEADQIERLFTASLHRYASGLGAISQSAADRSLELVGACSQRLNAVRTAVLAESSPADLNSLQREIEDTLSVCSRAAAALFCEQEQEIRKMMGILVETERTICANHEAGCRCHTESAKRPERLLRIAQFWDDEASPEGICQLTALVDAIWRDSQVTVRQMKKELKSFQRRLEQAETLAATDALTGLANRREAERWMREKAKAREKFCIMLFDLDGFKSINDRYGHHAGDQVLQNFSRRLLEQYRPGDLVSRWGGDEFLTIVAGDVDDATRRARQIAGRVQGAYSLRSAGRNVTLDVLVSVGVAEHKPGTDGETLFARADAALYQNKAAKSESPVPAAGT
jgi:diguanylate cyclase (GGDEF)-like protein